MAHIGCINFYAPLKLSIMGSFLNAIGSNVQSIANGALSSLIGGSISSHFSKSMMRYQDQLNDQNALDAYNRQRELMGDAASIQKQGMLKAGYNTAFGSNGSVMSAGSSQMSSVGQSSMGNSMPNSFQSMLDAKNVESNAKVADSHSRLLDSQAAGQNIDNDYKAANAIADLSSKAANTRDANAKAHLNEITAALEKKWGDRQYGAAVGKAESDASAAVDNAAIVGLNRQILQATFPDRVAYAHQLLENEQKKGKLLDAQVVVEKGIPRIQESEVAKNYADANLSNKKAEETSVDTQFARDTYSDREESIRLDNKYKDLQTIPHKLSEILIRSKVGRSVVSKLENGQTLNHDEIKYLKSLEFRNGVDENTFSGWIKMLIGLTAKD
nr:MAG TPA: hypothetical protein [Microviridae sp.]